MDIPYGGYLQDSCTGLSLSIVDLHDRVMFVSFIIIGFTVYLVLKSFKTKYYIPRLYFNDILEFGWVLIPVVILYSIAIYSIDLMYAMDEVYDPELTIGITGYQWYWGYNYPEYGVNVESRISSVSDVAALIRKYPANLNISLPIEIKLRNIEVDEAFLVPLDTNIRIVVTSADVIHSWVIPSWGVKLDAIPGRINSTGINIHRLGIFYGQCSELCGILHGFMPIKACCLSPASFVGEI